MSEIKGQLLGVLLAAIIFALVGTAIYGIFSTLTTNVETKVTENVDSIGQAPQGEVLSALLTF